MSGRFQFYIAGGEIPDMTLLNFLNIKKLPFYQGCINMFSHQTNDGFLGLYVLIAFLLSAGECEFSHQHENIISEDVIIKLLTFLS